MYARCYAFGDDIKPTQKVLEEMRHLSSKEIHPHTMEMVEDQIDKQEKVNRETEFTIEKTKSNGSWARGSYIEYVEHERFRRIHYE